MSTQQPTSAADVAEFASTLEDELAPAIPHPRARAVSCPQCATVLAVRFREHAWLKHRNRQYGINLARPAWARCDYCGTVSVIRAVP
jgi:hypothetical protein